MTTLRFEFHSLQQTAMEAPIRKGRVRSSTTSNSPRTDLNFSVTAPRDSVNSQDGESGGGLRRYGGLGVLNDLDILLSTRPTIDELKSQNIMPTGSDE